MKPSPLQLHSKMWKILASLFIPLLVNSLELEVSLPTRSQIKPVYISKLHIPQSEYDWRYFEELRSVLEFDFSTNGFSKVMRTQEELEETLKWPDVRTNFEIGVWKKEKIPYLFAIQIFQNRFQIVVFNIEKQTSKRYPDIELTGAIEEDRRSIHHLSDSIQKDLFGIEGIASLKILYSLRQKQSDGWVSEIWSCDSDGANPHQITNEKGYCLSPGYFPNGDSKNKEFYYVSYRLGQPKIFRSQFNKPEGSALIQLRGSQALPAMNKKGNQIAFITDAAGRPDLFIQNLDSKGNPIGKARQLFSAPRASQASPTFSPDGKQIAFVSDKDGPPRIYLLEISALKEPKKPNPRLLTKKNRENTSPAWSPDGTKLAYSAKVDGVRQIWIYDFTTEEETALTTSPENKENPSWAPDNLHIVYNTESEDVCDLYLIHLNQPEPILISKGQGQKRFAWWEMKNP